MHNLSPDFKLNNHYPAVSIDVKWAVGRLVEDESTALIDASCMVPYRSIILLQAVLGETLTTLGRP